MAWIRSLFFSVLLLQHGGKAQVSAPNRHHMSAQSYDTSKHAVSTKVTSASSISSDYFTLDASDPYHPYHPSSGSSASILPGVSTISSGSTTSERMTLSGHNTKTNNLGTSTAPDSVMTSTTHSSSVAHTEKTSSTGLSKSSQAISYTSSSGVSSVSTFSSTSTASLTATITQSSSSAAGTSTGMSIVVPPPDVRSSSTSSKISQSAKTSAPASVGSSASGHISSGSVVSSTVSSIISSKTIGATTRTNSQSESSSGTASGVKTSVVISSSTHVSTGTNSTHTASTVHTISKSDSTLPSLVPSTNGTTVGIPIVIPSISVSSSRSFGNSSIISSVRSTSLSSTAITSTGQSLSHSSTSVVSSSTLGLSSIRTSTGAASSSATSQSISRKPTTSAASGLVFTSTVNGTTIPVVVPAPTRGSTSMSQSTGTAIPTGASTSALVSTSFTTVNGTVVPIVIPVPTHGSTSVTVSSGSTNPTRVSTSTVKPSSSTMSGTAAPITVSAPILGSTSSITTDGTVLPIIVPVPTQGSTTVTTIKGTVIPIVVPPPTPGITSTMMVSGTAVPVIVPVSTFISTSTTTVNGTAIPIIIPVPVPVPGSPSKPLPSTPPKTSGATTGRSTAPSGTSPPTTAAPGSTVKTTLAPTTTGSPRASSSRASSTSTDHDVPVPIPVDLKKELDDDNDDTHALIILIGAWIKSPKPNPPDILPHLDDIFPRWDKLKPKLPQPPQNDPECEHLRKRFWPFNIVGNTVKNPVQAVEKIGLSLGKIRTQLVRGVIDGVADELVNLNALNDAMKQYDPLKDPCNKKSATPSSGSATTTSRSSSSSSSSCSARTVSNCNVICTTTRSINPTGVNSKRQVDKCSTTCDPPVVTCGASATTSISTVTSTIVPPNYCDNKCCKKLPDHTPKPMPTQNAGTTPRGLHKRVLPHKDKEPWNGNMFNFMRDMCNTYSIVEEMESKDVDRKPTTSAQYVFGPDAFNICFPGLYGCTMVIVLSRYYLWMAHFIELRSAMRPENWDEYVFKPIQFGEHGSNIPADQSLTELGKPGGAFSPDTNPVAIIVGPFERREDLDFSKPQSTNWEYPEYSAKIEDTIRRSLPDVRVVYAPYVANAAQFWGFDNVGTKEKFVDEDYPYKTPYGKVLVTYDPNKYGAKKGDGCKTYPAYEIWVGDAAFSWAQDEWPALPLQVPEGWQKREEAAPGVCPLPSSAVPTFSTAFRPSQSGGRSSSAARSTSTKSASSTKRSASSTKSDSSKKSTAAFTSTKPTSSSISPTATVPFNTPIPAKPTLPSITHIQCGDKDCDCCGNYADECKRLWCPLLGKSGSDCEDYCFSEQCHGDSPSECGPSARCYRPTCPDKKGDPPKKISNPDPIVAKQCLTDCECCKDWFDQCREKWLPKDYDRTKGFNFCISEMCFNEQSPSQCKGGPGGCSLFKNVCPDRKGEKPKAPVPELGPP